MNKKKQLMEWIGHVQYEVLYQDIWNEYNPWSGMGFGCGWWALISMHRTWQLETMFASEAIVHLFLMLPCKG